MNSKKLSEDIIDAEILKFLQEHGETVQQASNMLTCHGHCGFQSENIKEYYNMPKLSNTECRILAMNHKFTYRELRRMFPE